MTRCAGGPRRARPSKPPKVARCSASSTTAHDRSSARPTILRSSTSSRRLTSCSKGSRRPCSTHCGLRARDPGLVIVSITPYGRRGPWAERPVTEILVQAESGGLAGRGASDQTPIMAGGRITEWISGTYAAIAAAAAARRAAITGHGAHVDLSMAEVTTLVGAGYGEQRWTIAGRPPITGPERSFETPSIEPTLDGYVGFTTNSRQQFDSFLVLIERLDLLGDDSWACASDASSRKAEWNEIVRAFTTKHDTAEIVERAMELRIPVAPVGNGETITAIRPLRGPQRAGARPDGFVHDAAPAVAHPRHRSPAPTPCTAPRRAHRRDRAASPTASTRRPARPGCRLPASRVLDLTAWWAGPAGTGDARRARRRRDPRRVDHPARRHAHRPAAPPALDGPWWERSAHFLASNTNKRDLTLDPRHDPKGGSCCSDLIARADVVVENFTPRVLDNFGLAWDVIRELNPRCGDGADAGVRPRRPVARPRRLRADDGAGRRAGVDHGPRDDQPRIQQGPCDPNAGMHAVVRAARRARRARAHRARLARGAPDGGELR